MEILHISDIHFRIQYEKRQDGYGKMLCQMRNPLEKLDFCLEKAFSEHPGIGLVLISGDLCEDGSSADYESLRKFLESRLGTVPMEITLGNHDRKEEFRKGWMGKEEQNLPYNIDHTGGLYNHALRLEELAVLSMDSSCYGNSNGQIEEEAVQWLEEMIQKNADLPLLLMTHHHFLDGHETMPAVSCPESLKNLIANTGISAVLCGHTHHCFAGTFLGKPYYTADCMSFYGTNLEAGLVKFEEKYGYNYYETRKGQILRSCQETFSDNKLIEIVDWR